eukprot:681416-Amphidinium_carterae.1
MDIHIPKHATDSSALACVTFAMLSEPFDEKHYPWPCPPFDDWAITGVSTCPLLPSQKIHPSSSSYRQWVAGAPPLRAPAHKLQ